MATIPGGIFDNSANTQLLGDDGSRSLTTFLDNLGISESSITQITVSTTGTNTISDEYSVATFSVGTGQTANVVLSGTSGKTLIVSGGGGAMITGSHGGDSVLGGSGSDSIIGGFGDDQVRGGAGNDIVNGLQELTSDDGSVTAGDSLTGGGPAISNSQANYLLANAQKMGAGISAITDIRNALLLLSDNGTKTPDQLLVNFTRLVLAKNASTVEFKIDASTIDEDFLLMVNLNDLQGVDLALRGMEKIIALGAGTVRVDGTSGAMVVGDSANQRMLGGFGNDTLVGGAGNDTLTGGAGADVFGFIKRGHFVITDFEKGVDKLAFDFAGITTKAQIQSFLTSVTEADGNVTFNFGPTSSITLVGVSAVGVGADLLFNIT